MKKPAGEPGSYQSLFIKTFPRETKIEEITKMLTDKKFPEPAEVVTKPLRSSGRQYAIVEFKTHADAKKVFEAVSKDGGELMNGEKKMIVEIYEDRAGKKKNGKQSKKMGEKSKEGQDEAESKPKRRLYMKGMSDKTTEESLMKSRRRDKTRLRANQ